MEKMNEFFIKTEDVCASYEEDGGKRVGVLDRITLGIKKGEYVAILGHNGSGKSTFAKLLNMIHTPDSGKIYIDGVDITSDEMTEKDIYDIRRKVGMVFQNPDNQLVATIVEEDVAFGPENLGIPSAEIRKRVDEALAIVGMSEYVRHEPHRLSGGQKQRIAIAGVIAIMPECIIFDEATAMLDPSGRADVMKTIERLNKEMGVTVIHITHNMNEAALADRIIVINEGRIAMTGTPREIFSQVDKMKSLGLEVPQVSELCYLLKKEGIDVPCDLLYEDECAQELLRIMQG